MTSTRRSSPHGRRSRGGWMAYACMVIVLMVAVAMQHGAMAQEQPAAQTTQSQQAQSDQAAPAPASADAVPIVAVDAVPAGAPPPPPSVDVATPPPQAAASPAEVPAALATQSDPLAAQPLAASAEPAVPASAAPASAVPAAAEPAVTPTPSAADAAAEPAQPQATSALAAHREALSRARQQYAEAQQGQQEAMRRAAEALAQAEQRRAERVASGGPAASAVPAAVAPSAAADIPAAQPSAVEAPASPVDHAIPASDAAHAAHDRAHRVRGGAYAHQGHLHATNPETTLIQHGGHTHTVQDAEANGGLIFGTMLSVMVVAQLSLVLWKRYHMSSFDKATLFGMWSFPAGYCLMHGILEYWRMLLLWTAFSAACAWVMRRATAKPIERTTPRLVYSFFYWVYRVSYGTAFLGYLIIMGHFLGLAVILPVFPSPSAALLLLFYGLYFGVLGRDLANVCSTSMAVTMGYVARKGEIPRKAVPVNVCAICDGELLRSFRPVGGAAAEPDEKVHTLNCGHQFHDFCLRGWTMIGKRDTCASCSEKVQLKAVLKGPWEHTSVAWAVLLDALRYLIVFNPIVLVLAQVTLYFVY